MKEYVIGHDVGTSSDKAVLVDFDGNIIASATYNYKTIYLNNGYIEQDPEDYWKAIVATTKDLLKKLNLSHEKVTAIVFTTQSLGIIPVDKTGKVLNNNISWADGRAEKQAKKIMAKFGGQKIFNAITGTTIMGKDVIPKLLWIKQNENELYKKTKYFLDVNGYLKMKCTGKIVAEWSGASSYGFDLKKKNWLKPVFNISGIDINKLPPLVKSIDLIGTLTNEAAHILGLPSDTKVFGGCDDVQSAVIGSGMTHENEIHIYLGTSAWICAVTSKYTKFKNGTVAIQSADPFKTLICGASDAAGSNIKWIMDQFFKHEKEEYKEDIFKFMDNSIKNIPPGSEKLICTPWMYGERCPVSSTTTRATLFNISPIHTREHLMRSVYEGVAYNLCWILENLKKDYGFYSNDIRVIGGGALDDEWMQIISDVLNIKLKVVDNPQYAGCFGGAILGLISLGVCPNFEQVNRYIKITKTYTPDKNNSKSYSKLFDTYKRIYKDLKKTYKLINNEKA